jgi:hypothetical protein
MRQARHMLCLAATALITTVALVSCSGGGGSGSASESVFDVKPGQCFTAPSKVKAELSSLHRVACTRPHTQESYAAVPFQTSAAELASGAASADGAFPGADALTKFAKGACAQRFARYVGIDYLDSSLFFTYLLPSARSWEQDDDRTVLCFVTTTGGTLTSSVRGSKK